MTGRAISTLETRFTGKPPSTFLVSFCKAHWQGLSGFQVHGHLTHKPTSPVPVPAPASAPAPALPSSALSACGAQRALGRRSLLVQTPAKHPGVQLLAAMCSSPNDLTQNCARAACPAKSLLSFAVLLNKTVLPTNQVYDSLAPIPALLS